MIWITKIGEQISIKQTISFFSFLMFFQEPDVSGN